MNHLDHLWLQSFSAIAQTGSVTRAAQRVHRTPSAVSQHLRQLEGALAVRLIERTTRSLRLTAEGDRFLPHARQLLDWQAQAHAAVRNLPTPQVLRVGISEYFLPQRLDELLALLQREAQGARLELLWASSATLRGLWSAGEVDLAVITASEPPADARLLRREALAWVAAPNHVPDAQAPLPLVLLGQDCPVHHLALDALTRRGRAHELRLVCSGSQAAIAAIRAGWGVGCLNEAAIPPDLVPLARRQPGRWASPGRLSFYLLARPRLLALGSALSAWAA